MQTLVIKEDYKSEKNEIKITDHLISKDRLTLWVEYKGKCKKHKFELLSNGLFLKSNPPKLHLSLEAKTLDENCDDLVKDAVSFDISNAKYPDKNENYVVTLILSGYSEPITYKY